MKISTKAIRKPFDTSLIDKSSIELILQALNLGDKKAPEQETMLRLQETKKRNTSSIKRANKSNTE